MRSVFFSILMAFCFPFCHGQSSDSNYLRVRTFLDGSGSMSTEKTQYYDGLGRPTLAGTNGIGLSSNLFNYTLQQYDSCGRASISWLPKTSSGAFFGSDCSVTTYDALDRPVFVTTPGEDMNGRGKRIEYITNSSNSVKWYNADNMAMDRYYPACSLNGERTTDEDGHVVEVFKDLHGNLVLERRYIDASSFTDTYYVYNVLFQLCYVLSPMCTSASTEMLNAYAYQYTYDSKGRMATKKLPGCLTCEYHYDPADRLISSKDGNGIIHFYLYDSLNRLAVQGTCSSMLSNDLPASPVQFVNSGGICNTGYILPYGYTLSSPVLEIANYYDTYGFLSLSPLSESFQSFSLPPLPTSSAMSLQTGTMTLTSSGDRIYNDHYNDSRDNVTCRCEAYPSDVLHKTETVYSFTDKPLSIVTSLLRYDTAYVVSEIYTYSAETDMLQSKSVSYDDKTLNVSYTYDDYNRMLSKTYNDLAPIVYSYNVRDALTSISSPFFSEELYYSDDADGPCYNGNISSIVFNSNSLLEHCKYNYQYDGLNRLVNASHSGLYASFDSNGRYGEAVCYDANSAPLSLVRYGKNNTNQYTIIDALSYRYNGNQLVNVSDTCTHSLLYSNSFEFVNGNEGLAETEYTYDGNGNMTSDLNKGISSITYDKLNNPSRINYSNGKMINYDYSADGRKLSTTYVSVLSPLNPPIFPIFNSSENILEQPSLPSAHVSQDSMVSTASVVSSLSPLASTIMSHNAHNIRNISTTKYFGNYIFENGYLSTILLDDGYMSFSVPNNSYILLPIDVPYTAPTFHFYLKDHLGSNRVVISESGSVEQINNYYPYGGMIGDLSTNQWKHPYKYNGKEYETMYGLNTYDYGARQYDPARITWDRMDQFCEKYYHINPYVYCAGNPVRFIDPDGLESTPAEAATMALHVYGDKDSQKANLGNWRVSKKLWHFTEYIKWTKIHGL